MNKSCDILVIGAGPAGLAAARYCVSQSPAPSVLLVDKIRPWDHPFACAEGVFRPQFLQTITPADSWIRFLVDKAVYHSPDNSQLHYTDKNKGFIIDRSRMQKDLADECAEKGAECLFDKRVTSVGPWSAGGRVVGFEDGKSVNTRVVIDCSGPLSLFGKGEKIHNKPKDLEVACLAHLRMKDVDTETVHIHAGKKIAPAAYAWAFPRTENSLNVGVIVGSAFRSRVHIKALLESFIRTYYSGGVVERIFAGAIPCTFGRPPLATFGLIKAGDAASMVNPISRAGITEALLAGRMAGECAVAMLGAATKAGIKAAGKRYEREWHEKRGKRHVKLARVKQSLARVPDKDYNASARALADIPPGRLTMSKIFTVSLARFPRLVWALRHVL